MGLKKGDNFNGVKLEVDHINHDTLDNRKSNLRICTRSQNNANHNKQQKSKSPYKGIWFRNDIKKWSGSIKCNDQCYYLGVFENPEDAAKEYDRKSIELFGEFAKTNF